MTTKDTKLPYAVLTYFTKKSQAIAKRDPLINKFKEKWAAGDLIDSYGYDRVILAIDYLFEVNPSRATWTFFSRNCERILRAYDEAARDYEERRVRRAQLREWLDESGS